MQIYWSAVFNFSSLFHYLITQSFVVLSYTVRYMNVLADGFKVASSTLYRWRVPRHTVARCGDGIAQEFAQGIEVHLAGQLSIPLHLCEARRSNDIERIEIDLATFERGSIYLG